MRPLVVSSCLQGLHEDKINSVKCCAASNGQLTDLPPFVLVCTASGHSEGEVSSMA